MSKTHALYQRPACDRVGAAPARICYTVLLFVSADARVVRTALQMLPQVATLDFMVMNPQRNASPWPRDSGSKQHASP